MAKKRKSQPSVPQDQPTETQNDQNTLEPQLEQHENDENTLEPQLEADQYDDVEEDVEYEDEENVEGDEQEDDNNTINDERAEGAEENGDFEEGDDEPIEKLLEPFTKDQLMILVKEAVIKHPDFNDNVKKLADLDPVHRKIFVHGLGWDTTSETLITEFSKYGEIEDCKAVMDKVTGKSKGYAFILFKRRIGAKKALEVPQKTIGGRVASCQLASAGPVSGTGTGMVTGEGANVAPVSEYTQRKIFVSNVGADVDIGKLLEFFSKFGEIEEGPLGLDKQTGKPRGFCLFVYKTVEGAKKALEEPHKSFEGHALNCQKAVDGPKAGKGGSVGGFFQQQHQHGHHNSHQSYYGHPAKKGRYSGGSGSGGSAGHGGHLMAPAAGNAAVGFNPGFSPAAIGQALALIASQGAGLGLGNMLGGMGAPATQGGGYGAQGGASGYVAQGGYGQPDLQGAYANPQMGQGGVRPNQGGAPYMGHGY